MENNIIVQGLTKYYRGKKKAKVIGIEDVSFEAQAGSVFGLLGVNGAGKTTTLRVLATMLKPQAGTALVCGHDVNQEPELVRKSIGFMSSATSLYGRLTAREMVNYFGMLNGLSKEQIEQRSQQLYDLFDMHSFLNRRCSKLSSGMKQKVSIVRTVLHDPQVMIFDEPTAGLDVLTSRAIIEFVKDCRARGKCVLFSTHIMEEVEKLCDFVGVIHQGKLLAWEAVEKLRQRTPSTRVEDAFVQLVSTQGEQ
jgi:sodium transport system ATP-binding protein